MARLSKLTPEVASNIIGNIARGATYKDACEAARVDYSTFRRWVQRGEDAKNGIYGEFCESLLQAESALRIDLANSILKAAKHGDWRAAESYLKRRDPANWGDKTQTEQVGSVTFRVVYEDGDDAPS